MIRIEEAVRNSKSPFIRTLPRFAIRLMEKIIHQDEMNEIIASNAHKTGIEFVNGVLQECNVQVIVKGGENIPSGGKFVFVANHPVGAMDALSFLSMIDRFYPNVISPSNELFHYIPQLDSLIVGVNVFGKNTKETAEKINRLFESDSQVMIFPSGEVSRKTRGRIEDPEWQKTFITKAVAYKRDIIPVFISGRNSWLFYFVARLRKMLGIRMYLETILLPREMMKQRNKPVELTIGRPIRWQIFDSGKNHNQWAQFVKQTVYKIPNHS